MALVSAGWPAAVWPLRYVDAGEDDAGAEDQQGPAEARTPCAEAAANRSPKRQRRSIYSVQPESDDEDDADADDDRPGQPSPRSACELMVVPATPYAANPLCPGACLVSPSFPRRASSPCMVSSSFVEVVEEPNAGFRAYMEDRTAHMAVDGVTFLGVFDGHGGPDASSFLQRHLLPTLHTHLVPGSDVHDAITAAYSATNAAFRATGSIQGSTATTVILKERRLICANVGDSPAFVIKRSGEVFSVTSEHKIEGEEAARLAAAGVPIYRTPAGPAYMGTPDGTRWLNMSRAFGDFVYPAISCEPHMCTLDISDGKYLVIGSDGLTEKWPVAEAAQHVVQLAREGWGLAAMCRGMVERALARGSTDNTTCLICDLEAYSRQVEEAMDVVATADAIGAGGELQQPTAHEQAQAAAPADEPPAAVASCAAAQAAYEAPGCAPCTNVAAGAAEAAGQEAATAGLSPPAPAQHGGTEGASLRVAAQPDACGCAAGPSYDSESAAVLESVLAMLGAAYSAAQAASPQAAPVEAADGTGAQQRERPEAPCAGEAVGMPA